MGIPNRGPELQAVGYTLVIAAFIAVLLRIYVRVFLVRNFGRDDWTMVLAFVFFTLFVTCALVGVRYGTGRHKVDIDNDEDFSKAMMYWWFCYIWYCLSMICSKLSVGLFLLRITVRRSDILTIYAVLTLTIFTGLVFFFVTLFQCNPQSNFWKPTDTGTCVPVEVIMALTYLYSAVSVICDFTFALLPVVLIMQLQLKRSYKIALIPIVLMGCIASSAVLVRFAFVKDFKNPDFLWATIDIAIWTTTEQGLAITAGSLATLRPLFRQISTKFHSSNNTSDLTGNTAGASGNHVRITSASNSKHGIGGGSKRPRGPLSLTTMMARDDDMEEDDETRVGGGVHEMVVSPRIANKKRTSLWGANRVDEGDSEEELSPKWKEESVTPQMKT